MQLTVYKYIISLTVGFLFEKISVLLDSNVVCTFIVKKK
jgi:hypothetical protein